MSYDPPPPPPPSGGAPPPPPPGDLPPPPPPGGGYGGGYGGPPGGGYGGPPSPGPYGAPQPVGWDLGQAYSFGWNGFTKNVGPLIGAAAIFLVVSGVIAGIGTGVRLSLGSGFVPYLAGTGVQVALSLGIQAVLNGLLIQAALPVADGARFEFSRFTDFARVGPILVAGVLVGLVTLVGTLVCILPGIVAGFLLMYTPYFLVDQKMEPVAAMKASVELCRQNLGNTLVWWLLSTLTLLAGACLCGVGVLATLPITLLGTVYTYRTLQGRAVVMPS